MQQLRCMQLSISNLVKKEIWTANYIFKINIPNQTKLNNSNKDNKQNHLEDKYLPAGLPKYLFKYFLGNTH